MASNPPGQCCTLKHIHEGTPIGQIATIGDLETYAVGDESNGNIIVIATDIYGHQLVNVQLLADQMSKCGFRVLIPDILMGKPMKEGESIPDFIAAHSPEITSPIFNEFLSKIRQDLKPKHLFGIGYCFGAKFVIENLKKDGLLDAGAAAHPSFVSENDVEAISKPILISACQVDPIFPAELRHKTEEILTKKEGVFWEIDLFSGCSHGYSVRGDVSIPQVKYAKERTLSDQINFFNQFM